MKIVFQALAAVLVLGGAVMLNQGGASSEALGAPVGVGDERVCGVCVFRLNGEATCDGVP